MSDQYNSQYLRRLNIRQQGLLTKNTDLVQTINSLRYVQIDAINVVERAHHHVLSSRIENYSPCMLSQALQKKQVFEYWAHAAAYLPISDYRYSLYYKNRIKNGQQHWFKQEPAMMRKVLERITIDGPIKASDFKHNSKHVSDGWWDWKPAKVALEQLFMQGDIMVSRRDKFQKVYDLTQRVLPNAIDQSVPSEEEFARYLILQHMSAHGSGSVKQVSYLRKGIKPIVNRLMKEMAEDKQLNTYKINEDTTYILANALAPTHIPNKVWLLNPFDNMVIQRERLKQIFDFNYQIEVYVPAAKRIYGYYSLLILWQDKFVGRVDVKADRINKNLILQQLQIEDAVLKLEEMPPFVEALLFAIEGYRQFNQCHSWELKQCNNLVVGELLKQQSAYADK